MPIIRLVAHAPTPGVHFSGSIQVEGGFGAGATIAAGSVNISSDSSLTISPPTSRGSFSGPLNAGFAAYGAIAPTGNMTITTPAIPNAVLEQIVIGAENSTP